MEARRLTGWRNGQGTRVACESVAVSWRSNPYVSGAAWQFAPQQTTHQAAGGRRLEAAVPTQSRLVALAPRPMGDAGGHPAPNGLTSLAS